MDALCLEHLIQDVREVPLLEAARAMEGVRFLHGLSRRTLTFQYLLVEPALRECLRWAESDGPEDARKELGVEKLAAVRAWTCTVLCYVLTSVVRQKERTLESVQPVLLYGRLLFAGLHRLPDVYIVRDATLFRAEAGVMEGWDRKMCPPSGTFSFYVPTSFSLSAAVVRQFKSESGSRTVFIVHGASGWNLSMLSPYEEDEVLLEPVSTFQVLKADKFDEAHPDVQMGEVKPGLHRVEGRVRPGVSLLEGSRVKAAETESFSAWQEQEARAQREGAGRLDLEFDPFTEDEWVAMGKSVPKKDKTRRMAKLGKGAFMSTFRKRDRQAAAGGVRRFAVKVVDRQDMELQGITEEMVRREASTLELLRHKHIIRFYGLEETDDELGIVMELAEGGSLADLVKHRQAAGEGQAARLEPAELRAILLQAAGAMEYMHGQGVVHRDIKPENLLLAHAPGAAPLHIKVADFGVSTVLATHAGSHLSSKVGTDVYFAPERGYHKKYGALADMWALGCVVLELARLERLTQPLYHHESLDPDTASRREQLLAEVARFYPALGPIAEVSIRPSGACSIISTL